MIPGVCYSAAIPLLIYGLLLAFGLITRTDANVAVLFLVEAVAVTLTVRALARRYKPRKR